MIIVSDESKQEFIRVYIPIKYNFWQKQYNRIKIKLFTISLVPSKLDLVTNHAIFLTLVISIINY